MASDKDKNTKQAFQNYHAFPYVDFFLEFYFSITMVKIKQPRKEKPHFGHIF